MSVRTLSQGSTSSGFSSCWRNRSSSSSRCDSLSGVLADSSAKGSITPSIVAGTSTASILQCSLEARNSYTAQLGKDASMQLDPLQLVQRLSSQIASTATRAYNYRHILDHEQVGAFAVGPRHELCPSFPAATDIASNRFCFLANPITHTVECSTRHQSVFLFRFRRAPLLEALSQRKLQFANALDCKPRHYLCTERRKMSVVFNALRIVRVFVRLELEE